MKFLIPVTFSVLVAAIIYLVVDRGEEEASADLGPERKEAAAPTVSRSRTPYLVNTLIDPSLHLSDQIAAIRALPTDLTDGEFQALMDLLKDDVPSAMSASVWSTLQNEIMEVLRHRRYNLSQYPQAIAGILSDREASPIMRDYAAQHLSLYLSDRASSLEETVIHSSLNSLLAVLNGSREAEQQVTGTTLMALCDLNEKQSQLLQSHRPAIDQAVLKLLDFNHPVTFSNRISALQAAGRLKVTEALPQVRQMATSEEIKHSYRLSAIAALGYYAEAEDQSFLEEVAQGDSKFRFAAQTALKNF